MHKSHPFQSTTLDSFLLEISIDFQTSFPLLFRASLVAQMVKHLPAIQETQVWFLGWEDPLEKEMQSTPVLFSGKFRGRRSLVGYSAWGRKESATAERDFTSLTLNFIVPGIIFHFFFYLILPKYVSCSAVSDSLGPHGLWAPLSIEFSRQEYSRRVGSHSLLQGSNPGLPHCRQILYQLSHQGSLILLFLALSLSLWQN